MKSLRARSSSIRETNCTESGRRPSRYSPSQRYVVTSIGCFSTTAVTVPYAIPVSCTGMSAASKAALLCCHVADVVMSISWANEPRRASRTQPPTIHASNPASSRTSNARKAYVGTCKFTGRERHGEELFFCMLMAIPSAVADGKSIHPSHVIHILSAVLK